MTVHLQGLRTVPGTEEEVPGTQEILSYIQDGGVFD